MADNQNRDGLQNENVENNKTSQPNKGKKGSSSMATRKNTSSEGYGSSQRKEDKNVGPLDTDFDELPSESRTSRNNQTGPGLG